MKLTFLTFLCILLLGGCGATMRQDIQTLITENQANMTVCDEIGHELLKSWPFFSGVIRESVGHELKPDILESMTKLDELAKSDEKTWDRWDYGKAKGHALFVGYHLVEEGLINLVPKATDFFKLLGVSL